MFNQRIASIYLKLIGIAVMVAATSFFIMSVSMVTDGTAEEYAFGLLFFLPAAIAGLVVGFFAMLTIFAIASDLVLGDGLARIIGIAVAIGTCAIEFPFGLCVGMVVLLSLTVGWKPELGINDKKAADVARKDALERQQRKVSDDPSDQYLGSVCQRCGERYRMDLGKDKPWLCANCGGGSNHSLKADHPDGRRP